MNMRNKACLAGLLAGLLALPAAAREWTRFRGPNGQGHAVSLPQLPATLTPADYNWKVQLPGSGHSSPVIWDDRIFLTSADAERGERYVICLNRDDGKILWTEKFPFSLYQPHKFNSFASETPAVDEKGVYLAWGMPEKFEALALSHQGKLLWRRPVGSFTSQHGSAASPMIHGSNVIVSYEQEDVAGALVAFNKKTGEETWRLTREPGKSAYLTPAVRKRADGKEELIIASTAHGVTGVDPATGRVNWEIREIFKDRVVSSPVLAGSDLIVVTSGSGGQGRLAVAVKPGAQGKAPELAYAIRRAIPYVPTAVQANGRLYFWGDAGIVTCVRPDTGEVIFSERVGGNYFGSPIVAGNRIYCIETRGQLVCIEAAAELKELGRSELGELSHSTPAVDRGVMFIRTEKHLISAGKPAPGSAR